MRLLRIKMTTRRWMTAVAVAALLLGGTILTYRYLFLRRAYLQRAADHAECKALVLRNFDSMMYWENRWSDQREGLKGSYPWPDGRKRPAKPCRLCGRLC